MLTEEGRPSQADGTLTAATLALSVGEQVFSFSELVGISSSVDVLERIEPPDPDALRKKLPGKRTPPTITLKRGMTRSTDMSAWHELVMLGDISVARRSCTLVMHSADGEPVARYHLTEAWPSKLEIGALKAGSSEVLMETVTLVCDSIQRISV